MYSFFAVGARAIVVAVAIALECMDSVLLFIVIAQQCVDVYVVSSVDTDHRSCCVSCEN